MIIFVEIQLRKLFTHVSTSYWLVIIYSEILSFSAGILMPTAFHFRI